MDELKEEISDICEIANNLITRLQCLDNNISIEFINYVVGEVESNGYCNDEIAYNFIEE